ncbi:MAG: S53 family peptidase [Thermoplasmataceae archaeon]
MSKNVSHGRKNNSWHKIIIATSLVVVMLFLLSSGQFPHTNTNTATPYVAHNGSSYAGKRMLPLSGNVPYIMNNSNFSSDLKPIGMVPGNVPMILTLYLGFHNNKFLHWYVHQVNNPSSVLFHHYLTPSQFRTLFYPSASYIHDIESYYSHLGFKVWSYSYAPSVIVLSGNVSLVNSSFNVQEFYYKFLPDKTVFITNIANPSVPVQFSDIFHVYGLSYSSDALLSVKNVTALKSDTIIQGQTIGPMGNSFTLTPSNLYPFYQVNDMFKNNMNGKGTKIGILGVGQSVNMQSVSAFWNEYGIHNPVTRLINLTSNGQNPYGEGFEADLDVEWSGALSPYATIYDVMQPFNLTGIGDNAVNFELFYMLNVVDPNVVSGSWAELQFHHDAGFAQIYNYIGLQAVAEGITIFLGSADSHNINYLTVMASQYIMSVGGVDPVMNTTGQMTGQYAWYQPIYRWYGGALGSGGGLSFFFSRPLYQTDEVISTPANYVNRGQPDIAMPASHLITNFKGRWFVGGGTSYATPISAGIFASMESGMGFYSHHSVKLGWIQPALYNLGYGDQYGFDAYYNVNYLQPGSWLTGTGYLGTGWNNFTGIGSLQTYNLSRDILQYETVSHFPSYVYGLDGIQAIFKLGVV